MKYTKSNKKNYNRKKERIKDNKKQSNKKSKIDIMTNKYKKDNMKKIKRYKQKKIERRFKKKWSC